MRNDSVLIDHIERAKEGDQRSFTYLYERYYRLVRFIIYNIVKNHDVTADLVSITFTKAFQKISTYVDYISFEMWLKKIASNSAIDYIRHIKTEEETCYVDDSDNNVQLESSEFDPESSLVGLEEKEILLEKLTKLRSNYRNLLEMRYLKDMSYKDIAEAYGKPMGTVKSDLYKAKRRLKSFY